MVSAANTATIQVYEDRIELDSILQFDSGSFNIQHELISRTAK
jgi:hypothetical protein